MLARTPPLPALVLAKNNSSRRCTGRRGLCCTRSALDPAVVEAATVAVDSSKYVPSGMIEVEPWQIWVGTVAGFTPFVIAAYEFGKRILIQRQCALCKGCGLIQRGKYLRKCTACGGFLPWQSWERFWESSPGNGSVVRMPKGQTGVFYSVEQATAASEEMAAAREQFEREEAAKAAAVLSEATTAPQGAEEATSGTAQSRPQ